jgi:hypothetical protein
MPGKILGDGAGIAERQFPKGGRPSRRKLVVKHVLWGIGHFLAGMAGKFAIGALLALVAYAGIAKLASLPLPVPWGAKPALPSSSVVLTSITTERKLIVATGHYTATESVGTRLPGILCFFWCNTLTLHAVGTDDAVVDLSGLSTGDIKEAGTSVAVTVPPATIAPPNVDAAKSQLASSHGIINDLGRIVHDNPNAARPLYAQAQTDIQNAAERDPQLIRMAEQNARDFLTSLLKRLGFREVVVNFS